MAQVNRRINARTQITERRMLAEADQIDARVEPASRYRRWRGSYAVKNLFDVAGKPPSPAQSCSATARLPSTTVGRYDRSARQAVCLAEWSIWMPTPMGSPPKTATMAPPIIRTIRAHRRRLFRRFGGGGCRRAGSLLWEAIPTAQSASRPPCAVFWPEADVWPPVACGQPSVRRQPRSHWPVCPRVDDLAAVYDALQGHDPDDDAQADEAVAPLASGWNARRRVCARSAWRLFQRLVR